MKKIFCLVLFIGYIWACAESAMPASAKQGSVTPQSDLLTAPDAGKILGEPAHLEDSSTTRRSGVRQYLRYFMADSKDLKSGKTGALYFLLERYTEISASKAKYSDIKKANESHEGIKTLNDVGDEAYFHSDGQNFYFIMARKGLYVFNMKVNKITSNTSLEAFNRVARKITGNL
jgi:hypothetical protein